MFSLLNTSFIVCSVPFSEELHEVKSQTFYMPLLPECLIFQKTKQPECYELPLTQEELKTFRIFPGSRTWWEREKSSNNCMPAGWILAILAAPAQVGEEGPVQLLPALALWKQCYGSAPNQPTEPKVVLGKGKDRGLPYREANPEKQNKTKPTSGLKHKCLQEEGNTGQPKSALAQC